MTTMLPRKNLIKPSKVCARPETVVPTAASKVWKTPRIALKMVWKTARIEPKIPLMISLIEEIREGILGVCFVRFGLVLSL